MKKEVAITKHSGLFLYKCKNGIGPVVATALLIVVSVVAVIGFQTWFGTYSSDLFVKTEKDSSSTSNTNIETLIGDQLYFKNTLDDNISIKQIKLGSNECNISMNLTKGIHNISLGSCRDNLILDSSVGDIVVITDKQIYTKKHLFKDVNIVESLPYIPKFIDVNFIEAPEGLYYGLEYIFINVSANESIQNCSLNINGDINNSFVIEDKYCWINKSLSFLGNYSYNVSVIGENLAENVTLNKNINYTLVYDSCKSILDACKDDGDKSYIIDPDGSEDIFSLTEVYCDMSGGGWTLVAGISSSNSNHANSLEVTPNNLNVSNGIGKFDDSFINTIQSLNSNQLKLVCGSESDVYSNCNFDADAYIDSTDTDCKLGGSVSIGTTAYGVGQGIPNVGGESYYRSSYCTKGCCDVWNGGWATRSGNLWAR